MVGERGENVLGKSLKRLGKKGAYYRFSRKEPVEGVTSTIPMWMEIRGFMKEEGVGGLLGWAKGQGVPLLGRLYCSAK